MLTIVSMKSGDRITCARADRDIMVGREYTVMGPDRLGYFSFLDEIADRRFLDDSSWKSLGARKVDGDATGSETALRDALVMARIQEDAARHVRTAAEETIRQRLLNSIHLTAKLLRDGGFGETVRQAADLIHTEIHELGAVTHSDPDLRQDAVDVATGTPRQSDNPPPATGGGAS